MQSKRLLRVCLVLSMFAFLFTSNPARAELTVDVTLEGSSALYTVHAQVLPADADATVLMRLYREGRSFGRLRVDKTGEGTWESPLYRYLSPGEYTVKVEAKRTTPGGEKELATGIVSLTIESPYRSTVSTERAYAVRPARELPFLGTEQATIIDGEGEQTVGGDTIELDGELYTIEQADLNGDGAADIVAAGNTLFAYDVKNGAYLWAIDEHCLGCIELATEIDDIAIADVTGDDIPDVVTIDESDPDGARLVGSDGLTLWDGTNGNLLWTVDMQSQRQLPIYHLEVLDIADVDGDGDLDVVAGGYLGTDFGNVYDKDVLIAFDAKTKALGWAYSRPAEGVPPFALVSDPQAVKAGDVDGDGIAELIGGDINEQLYCLNIELTSERFVLEVPEIEDVISMELGDFDGDGDPDIAAGSDTYVTAYDEFGGQLWQFDEAQISADDWVDLEGMDFNGDGIPEIAAVSAGSYWAIINGATGFSLANGGFFSGGYSVAVGNLDGDDVPQMLWGDNADETAAVDVNTGNWLWWHDNNYNDTEDLEVADFFGTDHNAVAGVAEAQNFVYVLPGKAESNVWGRGFEPVGYDQGAEYASIMDVASADLNGDGIKDVIVVDDSVNRQVTAMDGLDGDYLWSHWCYEYPYILAPGDFDGDGSPEVATFGNGTLYLIDSDGSRMHQIDTGSTYEYFIVADIDQDNTDELILGNWKAEVKAFKYIKAAKTLQQLWVTSDINFRNFADDNEYEEGFAYGDYDGDGTDELLALGLSGTTIYQVYEINVTTGATTSVRSAGAPDYNTIALGQIDDDVQLEILLGYGNATDNGGVDAWDDVTAGGQYDYQYGGGASDQWADSYLVAGDLNGDGYDEAIFAGGSNDDAESNVSAVDNGTLLWSRDFSGTAALFESDAAWDIDELIAADLDGDCDLDVAVGAKRMLNLLMLDGLDGDDLIDPVIIDGPGNTTTQLAEGNFVPGPGGGVDIAANGFQSVGVFEAPSVPKPNGRLVWSSTAGEVELWTLKADESSAESVKSYGPYAGWTATSYHVENDGTKRLLWTDTSGRANLWTLDANDDYVSHKSYGPLAGWTATSYHQDMDGTKRLLWIHTSGKANLWTLDANEDYFAHKSYGPFAGWRATSYRQDCDGKGRILWVYTSGKANLWTLTNDESGAESVKTYGPRDGWTAESYDY